MMKTIGYVSEADPFKDKKAWSGSIYKIREGIENAGYNVVWIPYSSRTFMHKAVIALLRLCFGRNVVIDHNQYFQKLRAMTIDIELVNKCDCLFFPGGGTTGLF